MKWSRNSKEFAYADYTSDCGRFVVRDMSMNDHTGWWKQNGRRGYWWAVIENTEDGEKIIQGNFKTAKSAKEFAESMKEVQ